MKNDETSVIVGAREITIDYLPSFMHTYHLYLLLTLNEE